MSKEALSSGLPVLNRPSINNLFFFLCHSFTNPVSSSGGICSAIKFLANSKAATVIDSLQFSFQQQKTAKERGVVVLLKPS